MATKKKSGGTILDEWEKWDKQKANARYQAERRRTIDKVVKAIIDKILGIFIKKK